MGFRSPQLRRWLTEDQDSGANAPFGKGGDPSRESEVRSRYIDHWQRDWAKLSSQNSINQAKGEQTGVRKPSQLHDLAGLSFDQHWSQLITE